MSFSRNHIALAILAASLQFAAPAYSEPAAVTETVSNKHGEHEAFAHSFAQTVLAIIQDTKKSYADRKDVLRTAFAKLVDIDWIAKFVLGKQWANATPDQRERYTTLYRKFLTETYVANFAENPDKRIRDIKIDAVTGESAEDDSDFTVRTQMMLADMENLRVAYLVREDEGHYKVRDISIENVSLIATHRSEFSALAASHGVEGVIAHLEAALNKPSDMAVSMNMVQ